MTEVTGLSDDVYAEVQIDQQDVPTTAFDKIVSRGGNNPDGKFILPE